MLIEAQTMEKVKREGGSKDKIESMVQDQIQDQMTQIDDSNTFMQNNEILEYGATLENKEF